MTLRLLTTLALFTAVVGSATVITTPPAFARSGSCGSAMSTKNTHGMDMHDSKNAMGANCPVAAGAREIAVNAGDLTFDPSDITIAAGENVAIVLTSSDIAHDFYVKGLGHIVHAKADKTARGGFRIKKPGTYAFWCTIKGHKEAGMKGTITVTA